MYNEENFFAKVIVIEKYFEVGYRGNHSISTVGSARKEVDFYAKVKDENNNIFKCIIINEQLYDRLVEGMKINAKFSKYLAPNNEFSFMITEFGLIYDDSTSEVINNYVNKEMKRLATFSNNNGIRVEKGKTENGIFIVASLFILIFGCVFYFIKYSGNITEYTNELSGPLVFSCIGIVALFVSILFNTYGLRYNIVARRFFVLFSILLCDGVTLASNLFAPEKHYELNIGITVILVLVTVFFFRKGLRYERTKTKFRFAIKNVFEMNGKYRVVLTKLSDDGEPIGYPYLVYDTVNVDKFRQFKYVDLDVKNITSLDLNINNPNYWYYDISYIDDSKFVGKNLAAVTNYVYHNR